MWNRSPCLNVAKTTLTRLVALLLLAALAALAACVRPPDRVAQVGLASAPITLDPRYATDATSWRLCRLLFEAPAGFDATFMPIPALMSWQRVAPRRYRFTTGQRSRTARRAQRASRGPAWAEWDRRTCRGRARPSWRS